MVNLYVQRPDVQKAIRNLSVTTERKIMLVATSVGVEIVAYLRSLTAEIRPSARRPSGAQTGLRRAHPGHWADITGQLALSYWYRVEVISGGVNLFVGNSAEYAIWLEVKEGFFVVSGVADADGPYMKALAKVAAQIAPDWRVSTPGLSF